ncbi:MAG: sulfatase-like hydrolase/transferase, partial [Acidobacteria bacterium]|nr:sulfatase-like hydrolase/transferase [Acidobacteriota bacterium]
MVVITIDTLRADHVECYGYPRVRTPHINQLARDGVLFRNAVSPVPLTLPAHCSLFTGRYPIEHGVQDQSGFFLAPGSETLASRLKASGLATGAFVGSFVLDSRFGLNQGFDYYYDRFDASRAEGSSPEALERRAEVVAKEALRWMEEPRPQGFFAWLHFYDPHTPYSPPEPFASLYRDRPYDGEIAYTDSAVGTVLDFLNRKSWYEDALVVLTSDHGEDLGQHGENTHGYFLYDATVRVPLVIKLPRKAAAGRTVESQVRLIDVMPTILQAVSESGQESSHTGSLLPVLSSTGKRTSEEAFGETSYPYRHFGWSPLRYVRTDQYKYIHAPSPELYDLRKDPAETANLFNSQRELADRLRERLWAGYVQLEGARSAGNRTSQTDVNLARQLSSLGYASGSSRAARLGLDKNLPDPKDKLQLYQLYLNALLDSQNNRLDEAANKFNKVLAEDTGIVDAYINLGLIYNRKGKHQQAIQQFRQALAADDANEVATYNLAHSYALAGQLPEAIHGFERTLALNPKEGRARVGLGIAYQLQGDLDRALEQYRHALELDPDDTTAHNNVASICLTRRDVDKAIFSLRQSLGIDERNPETRNLLGSALWLKNDAEAAIAEFQEAIRLKKDYVDPYLNLGML